MGVRKEPVGARRVKELGARTLFRTNFGRFRLKTPSYHFRSPSTLSTAKIAVAS